MAEHVQTGGVMRFRYSGEGPKISEKEKREIEEAYRRVDERKQQEKRRRKNKFLFWILLLIILLGISVYVLLT